MRPVDEGRRDRGILPEQLTPSIFGKAHDLLALEDQISVFNNRFANRFGFGGVQRAIEQYKLLKVGEYGEINWVCFNRKAQLLRKRVERKPCCVFRIWR